MNWGRRIVQERDRVGKSEQVRGVELPRKMTMLGRTEM